VLGSRIQLPDASTMTGDGDPKPRFWRKFNAWRTDPFRHKAHISEWMKVLPCLGSTTNQTTLFLQPREWNGLAAVEDVTADPVTESLAA